MTFQEANQLIEKIKTLNLNIDSQTLERVVNEIKPILYLYAFKDYFYAIFGSLIILIALYIIYRIFKFYHS